MIYSCTQYAGLPRERMLLDIRLGEELPVVDWLVITEGDHTFSGSPKPFTLKREKDVLSNPRVRPIFFKLGKANLLDTWENAKRQRNAPQTVLDLADDDVLLWSDLDEVHRRQELPAIIDRALDTGYVHLRMVNHCFRVNYFGRGYWKYIRGAFAVTGRYLRRHRVTLHQLRKEWSSQARERGAPVPFMDTDGHHFDYMLTPQEIKHKLKCMAASYLRRHQYTSIRSIRYAISHGLDLFQRTKDRVWGVGEIDHTYPQTMLDQLERWRPWIV